MLFCSFLQAHYRSGKSARDRNQLSFSAAHPSSRLDTDRWLLFKKLPEYTIHTKRKQREREVVQLPLFETDQASVATALSLSLCRPLAAEDKPTRSQAKNRKGKLSFSFFDVPCRVYTRVRGQIPENNSCRC